MKLGDYKGNKRAEPFFRKNLILPKFGLTCEKMAMFGQNRSFWDIAKNGSNKFSNIALKEEPKIVLHDKI